MYMYNNRNKVGAQPLLHLELVNWHHVIGKALTIQGKRMSILVQIQAMPPMGKIRISQNLISFHSAPIVREPMPFRRLLPECT